MSGKSEYRNAAKISQKVNLPRGEWITVSLEQRSDVADHLEIYDNLEKAMEQILFDLKAEKKPPTQSTKPAPQKHEPPGKKNDGITQPQIRYIYHLTKALDMPVPLDLKTWTKKRASEYIEELRVMQEGS